MARQQLMTQREYATRKGCSPQYIGKLVSQGKIRKVGSKIDARQADAALAAWRRTGRVVGRKNTRKAAGTAKPLARRGGSGSRTISGGGSRPESATANLTKWRATREEAQAKLAELDYRRAMKELLPASEVLAAERQKNANIRASFRRLGRSMAPLLHRASSPAEVEEMLIGEIDQILEELARDPLGIDELKPAEVAPVEEQNPVEVEAAIAATVDQVGQAPAAEVSL